MSRRHMASLAGWAWADALILEAASVAAGLEIRRCKRRSKPVGFPATTLTLAVVLSLAAQVVEAEPTIIGWIAAALPALGFLAMVKMAMSRADTTPVPDSTATPVVGSGTVPDTTALVPDRTNPVPDDADETGAVRDRRGPSPDVTALVPAARQAARSLAAEGVALNRTSLAAQPRADGHQLSTAAATALVRQLRIEPSADLSAPGEDVA